MGGKKERTKVMNRLAKEERNRYHREWYAKNQEKQREYMRRYWEKRAQNRKKAEENGNEKEGEQ